MEREIQIKNKKFVVTEVKAVHHDHESLIATWSGRTYLMRVYKEGYAQVMADYKTLKHAGINMAKICFGGCTNINPGIVKVPTAMKSDYGLAAVSNSITLTPGTITMETAEDENGQNYLYVHWIDVKETDPEKAGEAIKGTMEKALKEVWQ